MRTYEQALQRAAEQGGPVLRGTADMYVGLSELHRERNDLPAAIQNLLRSQKLGERRVAAEPLPLAGRDGSYPPGGRRSERRT